MVKASVVKKLPRMLRRVIFANGSARLLLGNPFVGGGESESGQKEGKENYESRYVFGSGKRDETGVYEQKRTRAGKENNGSRRKMTGGACIHNLNLQEGRISRRREKKKKKTRVEGN